MCILLLTFELAHQFLMYRKACLAVTDSQEKTIFAFVLGLIHFHKQDWVGIWHSQKYPLKLHHCHLTNVPVWRGWFDSKFSV